MDKKEAALREAIGGLLATQPFGVLATGDAGAPYTSLVGFVADPGLAGILFATMVNTRKFANLERDPRVALLVDNRANRPDDLLTARALTVIGQARAVPGEGAAPGRDAYLAKFPHLRQFVDDPRCAIVRIRVSRYILVERFQEVWQLEMNEEVDNPAR